MVEISIKRKEYFKLFANPAMCGMTGIGFTDAINLRVP